MGFCGALHRGSKSGHAAGCEDVQDDVEAGLGMSVVLHELEVNAVPRASGVFSWKKVCTHAAIFQDLKIYRAKRHKQNLQKG